MLGVIGRWYRSKFSDPDSVMLLMLLIMTSVVLAVWGGILMPVIVAAVIAYLLDWPVNRLVVTGMGRSLSASIVLIVFVTICILMAVILVPAIAQQGANFVAELPEIWGQAQVWLMTLPERYPAYIQTDQIESMMAGVNDRVVGIGEDIITASFSSIVSAAALLIYLILVPLMVFFMLKDKKELLGNLLGFLPKERRLINQVGTEMNTQIANYIRGKVIEILIVGAVSAITFALMDLRYALLLGTLVGFSVLIPYIGAAVVTIPVAVVGLFQFGVSAEFGYLMFAYGIIQALDGNLLVPILFSEAVSLHPVYIIIAVLFFGGLWGFWGVFFAIPLATLVKAVINAWSSKSVPDDTEPEEVAA